MADWCLRKAGRFKKARHRRDLISRGAEELRAIGERLFGALRENAPTITVEEKANRTINIPSIYGNRQQIQNVYFLALVETIRMGLTIGMFPIIRSDAFLVASWEVFCGDAIAAWNDETSVGFSSSLWYASIDGSEPCWWEVPYRHVRGTDGEFTFLPPENDAALGVSQVLHSWSAPSRRKLIGENVDKFIDDWIERFANLFP